MSKAIYTTLFLSFLGLSTRAQIISKFTWESNPATTAVVGPNGTSISTFASSSTGGVGGTSGLNAGPGRHDVNLVVPGAVFQVPGLDISVDFAKQENGASFFTIGGLDLGIAGGALYVKYIVKAAGSDVSVSATNKYTLSDANWHTYRFVYNNNTGIAKLYVDGASVYTASYAAGSPLSWTGAVDANIASGMDGGNSNIPTMDNLIVQVPPATLPLQLISFDARKTGGNNALSWTTTREQDLQAFIIERSTDGQYFDAIGTVPAAGTYEGNQAYSFTDAKASTTSYYRLKMMDIDGQYSYSPIKKVNTANTAATVSITCYPNPTVDNASLAIRDAGGAASYSVITADGRILQTGQIAAGNGSTVRQASLNLSTAPKGILFIRVQMDGGAMQTVKILKK